MALNLKITSLFLFVLKTIRMMLTVVTVTFTAKYFGVSIERDMWVLALSFITTLNLAIWGPVNEVFRTKFVFLKEKEGECIALSKTSSLIGFIFLVTLGIIVVLFLFSSPISRYLTNGMASSSDSIFNTLLLLLTPTLLINEITYISTSVLNAYEVYYLPEIVGIISGVVNLGAILVFAPIIGIYSLMIANYFGALFMIFIVLYFLSKKKINIWNKIIKFDWKEVKVFLIFALPFFFPYFVGQMNGLVEKYLSGILGSGMISSLDYSRQFIAVLQSVISSVLTTLVVPILAKSYINGHGENFTITIKESLIVTSLIVCVASVFLLGLTEPVCNFFFYRGKISLHNLNVIILLTRSFGIAFWGVVAYVIFGYALLASNQGKYYATIGVVNQILILVFNVLLVPKYGLIIFPVTYGSIHLLSGIIMFFKLKVEGHAIIALTLFKSICISCILAVVYYHANNTINIDNDMFRLIFVSGTLILTMPVVAQIMGINLKKYMNITFLRHGNK